ncbi:dynein 16 kDa light chain, flagellar outer arm, putative [Perkinsus marinus ATCC 50983]|uniref:Dynein 16 kDa light chain, flagellar outer arm, putative n=1 Tax=Perkinsus marinus (strain ATCC 50983 / TXsc) TaxID=423536 RepID=C5LTE3_PERM5|nr:dynein 16 kDa light chain, flagellar outer arm, putative [Perkinsus marinus ATCC 50983]EER00111.1 dynein 16 kDa light chain, flagellar outer arm, putative [Perkinsus marinus ATCC 50983]|eukprot:XP_002767393.1 dynein 16 kDa light chain, flagellar outer arm, putative [Perkinsus marinus ATCC 50983]
MANKKELISTYTDEDQFRAVIEDDKDKRLHIVDVYTAWCGPCQQIVPTFKNLQINMDAFDDRINFIQIDRQTVGEYSEKFKSTSSPRFLLYKVDKDGNLVAEVEGCNAPQILDLIDEYAPSPPALDD